MSASGHVPGFDWLRAVAAVAVVLIHAAAGASNAARPAVALSQFAVPCFALLAGYLAADGARRRPQSWPAYARQRATRLLPAYVLWSVAYAMMNIALDTFQHKPVTLGGAEWWARTVLLGAAGPHLWFLPVLLYSQVLIYPLLRAAGTADEPTPRAIVVLAILAAALSLTLCVVLPALPSNVSLVGFARLYFFRVLGYLLLGCAARWTRDAWLVAWRSRGIPLLTVAAVSVAACWVATLRPATFLATVVLSVTLFLLAAAARMRIPPLVSVLSQASMGIYLAHVVFTTILRMAWVRATGVPAGLGVTLVITVVAVAASCGVSRVMTRIPLLRSFAA